MYSAWIKNIPRLREALGANSHIKGGFFAEPVSKSNALFGVKFARRGGLTALCSFSATDSDMDIDKEDETKWSY